MGKINILIGKNIISSNTIHEEETRQTVENEEKRTLFQRLLEIFKKN